MHWAIVMAGGSGTRFWPLSRAARPKQLLPLAGGDLSLLRQTVERVLPLVPIERILVVTADRLAKATRAELPGLPRENLLAEPAPRNTAPCVGWGALVARRRDPEAVLSVLAADHHVADETAWRAAVERALEAAADGSLVTMGIAPTRPETGYGWLEVGEETAPGVRDVRRFVEKPDRARAEAFLAGGAHLWNSGQFFFRADAILDAIGEHLPALAEGLGLRLRATSAGTAAAEGAARARRRGAGARRPRGHTDRTIRAAYGALPSISLDHGVMESAARVRVVTASVGWSDVGSFVTAWELADKDEDQSALSEGTIAIDSHRLYVRAPAGKTVAVVGLADIVVVDTPDALLVLPRERAQDVKSVVAELVRRGRTDRL